MNFLNFFRHDEGAPEPRQQGAYGDALLAQILARAAPGGTGDVRTVAGVEIAAGVVARAFAVAQVEGANVPSSIMAHIGRRLITDGEAVVFLDRGEWLPATSVADISGGPRRGDWVYRFELQGPGTDVRHHVAGAHRVMHPRYSFDPIAPWRGIAPLDRAISSGELAARLERSLSEEMAAPVGHLLPVPVDAKDSTIETLKTDLAALAGRISVVETMAGGWGEGRSMSPRSEYQPQRIGPSPPAVVPQVYHALLLSVLAVCGVPVELVASAEGTGQREAWRRCLHGTIAPLGRLVAEELSRIAAREVKVSFRDLFAGDLAGRARAFQSLVGGGMELNQAAALSGLLSPED